MVRMGYHSLEKKFESLQQLVEKALLNGSATNKKPSKKRGQRNNNSTSLRLGFE